MKLLVGLGNPGEKFKHTRHNIGFDLIDMIHDTYQFPDWSEKFNGLVSIKDINNEKIILLKPMTFMNDSGDSVLPIKSFYKIDNNDIFVFHDDLDLNFRKLKFKKGGGSGGHNGIKSIDENIGNEYYRIRMGIGKPNKDVISFVLGKFDNYDQVIELNKFLVDNFEDIINLNFNDIMNKNKLEIKVDTSEKDK